MPDVRLRTVNLPRGLTAFAREREWPAVVRFTVRETIGTVEISVTPGQKDDPCYAEIAAHLNDEAAGWLSQWIVTHRFVSEIHEDVLPFVVALRSALRRLSHVLQFTYPLDNFRGFSEYAIEWSLDGTEWERTSYGGRGYGGARVSFLDLDDASAPSVQAQLDQDVRPLEGFVHLQRAKDEYDPRHRWLDATIAAELAAKEFLGRFQPMLAPIVAELPSPPLDKLYGSLLKEYAGQESPMRKWLKHGGETRNILIHRPGAPTPDRQDAADYLNAVIAALYHLMTLLYPHDEGIRAIAEDRIRLAERKSPPTRKR